MNNRDRKIILKLRDKIVSEKRKALFLIQDTIDDFDFNRGKFYAYQEMEHMFEDEFDGKIIINNREQINGKRQK